MMQPSLSPEDRAQIRSGPLPQSEAMLASLLRSGQLNQQALGELALDLFQAARYGLATMLFAHWASLEPENPEHWSNLGLSLFRQNQVDQARQVMEYALELNPEFFAALSNLCDVYRELGQIDAQLGCAERCVGIQPGSAVAHNNLGSALWQSGRIDDAKLAFEHSLRLAPDYFEARFNIARLASDCGDHASALAFYEDSLRGDTLDPRRREVVEHHLSFEYLNAGRLTEGWELYERGFSALVPPSLARRPDRHFAVPAWDGRPLAAGKSLLLWREQGVGDELRFLSLLPQLEVGQGRVILETDRRLVDALQRSFPHFLVRASQAPEGEAGAALAADFDYHLPIGSLPRLSMRSRTIYPKLGGYLKASPWQSGRFAQRLAPYEGQRIVGICWRSHKLSATRNRKYTALADWAQVLSMPGLVFVNLQYGECEEELSIIEKQFGIRILRWQDVDLKDDIEAVLGLMQNLDLVISPSTAVLPMAGALGRPAIYIGHANWMLLGERDCYPWFNSVKPLLAAPENSVASLIPSVAPLISALPEAFTSWNAAQ